MDKNLIASIICGFVAIALFVCFVPTSFYLATYTQTEYEVNGYTQIERIDGWQFIQGGAAWSRETGEVVDALRKSYQSCPTAYVEVQNKDKTSVVFNVQIIFTASGKRYVKNYSLSLHSGELTTVRYQECDIEGDNWSFDYKVTPEGGVTIECKRLPLLNYFLLWLHSAFDENLTIVDSESYCDWYYQ